MLHIEKKKVMLSYLMNEFRDGFIFWGLDLKKDLSGHNERP
jgi:hypothetical protein